MNLVGKILGSIRENVTISLQKKTRGQAVLEFALLLPILLLLLIGTLEFGRLFFAKIVITNAAREGVYYLSMHTTDKTNCSGVAPNQICYLTTRQAVKDEANASGLTLTDTDISIGTPCCAIGSLAVVNVQTTVKNVFLVTLLPGGQNVKINKGSITLMTSARMVVQ